ncbi:hypothetical protein D9619_000456 [Psilocybe cf. subviscida]|uniref:F-box domain-containing protein n=1 Tax=Psilocybe cf. subviscida TaxID=2480587 RepID=A0A8H5BGI4_9AGAR|nr:hypothetical protein D9619_000456 [Psilocybe cf. subviscida]
MSSSDLLWDVDVNAVHQDIAHHQQAIASLDSEIEGLMRTIRQLQYKKQVHADHIKYCNGLISLAKRLPPEILAAIFEECVRDGWTKTPLVVSHVCSSWRKAAETPAVWAHVVINMDAPNTLQRTRLWLDRSKEAPLTVDITINEDTSHLEETMKLLSAHIHRWASLTVKAEVVARVNQMLRVCTGSALNLRFVDISVKYALIAADGFGLEEADYELVALREFSERVNANDCKTLRIQHSAIPSPNVLPPSIRNLHLQLEATTTNVAEQTLTKLAGVLQGLPDLQSLCVEVKEYDADQFFRSDNPDDQQTVELACLESLILTGSNNLVRILPHIHTPNLIHLGLRSSLDKYEPEMGSWITTFLAQSCPPLTRLEIHDLALQSQDYHIIIRALPALEDLRLHDSDILDVTINELATQNICPGLKYLDLRWCGRLTGRALVEFVRSRVPAAVSIGSMSSSAIAEVTLINCADVKEDDIIALAGLTICRLVHLGSRDFCNEEGCCDNDRYRRRLKQRGTLTSLIGNAHSKTRLIL